MLRYKSKFNTSYKRIIFSVLFIGFILLCILIEQESPKISGIADSIRILSFNIRYGTADDGENSWEHRRYLVNEIIGNYDIIGLQEALIFQIDEILEASPGYEMTGVGRDDGDTLGEYSAILFKTDRFSLLKYGTLWLSDTPEVPGSMSWGNRIPRILTWAKLKDMNTGEKLFIFNTHWDHESEDSRVKSALFLVETITEFAGFHDPVIITGDFNAGPETPEIKGVFYAKNIEDGEFRDSYLDISQKSAMIGTYHGFRGERNGEKIDYVIVNQMIRIINAEIIYEHDKGRYPSDHFPVMAEIVIKTE